MLYFLVSEKQMKTPVFRKIFSFDPRFFAWQLRELGEKFGVGMQFM